MLIFDSNDTFYLIARAAFFGLTILPILYVAAGTVIGLLAPGCRSSVRCRERRRGSPPSI